MLPAKARLSAKEVRKVLREGRLMRGKTLSVRHMPAERPQLAVVVSSKIARTAIRRNEVRRFVYNTLGALSLPAAKAVFLVRSVPIDSEELKNICSKLS